MDRYGGQYGVYTTTVPSPTPRGEAERPSLALEAARVEGLMKRFAATQAAAGLSRAGRDACGWVPPRRAGPGCSVLDVRLRVGGMPWAEVRRPKAQAH